jgi:hypothetical protein
MYIVFVGAIIHGIKIVYAIFGLVENLVDEIGTYEPASAGH